MRSFEKEIAATQQWFDSTRFAGIVSLYTARKVERNVLRCSWRRPRVQ